MHVYFLFTTTVIVIIIIIIFIIVVVVIIIIIFLLLLLFCWLCVLAILWVYHRVQTRTHTTHTRAHTQYGGSSPSSLFCSPPSKSELGLRMERTKPTEQMPLQPSPFVLELLQLQEPCISYEVGGG